jgi:hypothetical protein
LRLGSIQGTSDARPIMGVTAARGIRGGKAGRASLKQLLEDRTLSPGRSCMLHDLS